MPDDDGPPSPFGHPDPGRPAPLPVNGLGLGGCAPGQGLRAPAPVTREPADRPGLDADRPGLDAADGPLAAVRAHDEYARRCRNPHAEPGYQRALSRLRLWAPDCLAACLVGELRYRRAERRCLTVSQAPESPGSLDDLDAAYRARDAAWLDWHGGYTIACEVCRCLKRPRDFAAPPPRPG